MPLTSNSLYLHIGAEKTGTKSIQQFLSDRHRTLWREHRIHYPVLSPLYHGGAHTPFAAAFASQGRLDFVPPGLAVEAEKVTSELQSISASLHTGSNALHAILLSAEHLSSRVFGHEIPRLASVLRNALPDYLVKIIYFVRSQPGQYCAALSTRLKSGGINWPSPDQITRGDRFYNHLQVASDWEKGFGEGSVCIVNYHRGNSIKSLMEVIAPEHAAFDIPVKYRKNVSLSHEQCRILHAINNTFPPRDRESPAMFRFRRKYVEMVIGYLDTMSIRRNDISVVLSETEKERFTSEFRETNDALRRQFSTGFNLNDFMEWVVPNPSETKSPVVGLWEAIAEGAPAADQGEGALMTYMDGQLRRMRHHAATM